jgi:hypothetical protein
VSRAVTGCGQLCVSLPPSLHTMEQANLLSQQHTTRVTVFQHSFTHTHTNAPGRTATPRTTPFKGQPVEREQNRTERESVVLGECVCQRLDFGLGVLDIKMATQVCGLPNPAHRTNDSGLPIDMLVHVSNHHHTHDGAHHDGDNFNPNESVSVCEINAT